jgi:hypothetical protein
VLAADAGNPVVRAYDEGRPGHPLMLRGAALVAARESPDDGLRAALAPFPETKVDCTGLGVACDLDRPLAAAHGSSAVERARSGRIGTGAAPAP